MVKPFRIFASSPIEDINQVTFPKLASYKLDGVRCVVLNGVVYTGRDMKPVQNRRIQEALQRYEGFDGELIVGSPTAADSCRVTQSVVNSKDAPIENLSYYVFDLHSTGKVFSERAEELRWRVFNANMSLYEAGLDTFLYWCSQVLIEDLQSLERLLSEAERLGYEGLILKNPDGLYKNGRATWKSQDNLKWKRFADGEAVIVDVVEELKNNNASVRNNAGFLEKSSRKENKVGTGRIGSFICRDNIRFPYVDFAVSATTISNDESAQMFADKEALVGSVLTYRYATHGIKDRPRFPVFDKFRSDLTPEELEMLDGRVFTRTF